MPDLLLLALNGRLHSRPLGSPLPGGQQSARRRAVRVSQERGLRLAVSNAR
jgi:hypothetical protein